jgi:hypothetical protein
MAASEAERPRGDALRLRAMGLVVEPGGAVALAAGSPGKDRDEGGDDGDRLFGQQCRSDRLCRRSDRRRMKEYRRMPGKIRVGIGGWTFEPWRETFYPPKWPKARELEYASGKMTAIEINGTFYSTQKPATWADWAKRTPDDFVFSVKASRFCTNRRVLAEAAESIDKFINQGLAELGPKLGPILWQFAATKKVRSRRFRRLPQTAARERGRCSAAPRDRTPA